MSSPLLDLVCELQLAARTERKQSTRRLLIEAARWIWQYNTQAEEEPVPLPCPLCRSTSTDCGCD